MTIHERPHTCQSCGRACGACAEAAQHGQPLPHTVKLPWCSWCTTIYAANAPDPETGRVHCQKCRSPFPDLVGFIAAGLDQYPALCRRCRPAAERRDERQQPRARAPRTKTADPVPALAPEPRKTTDPAEQSWARGGFRPRVGPETDESELGEGGVAWPGTRVAK